jgi:sigma-B regulation protein RsbU (phosphoserine phosphatase)
MNPSTGRPITLSPGPRRACDAWLRELPTELTHTLLRPRDLESLLQRCERYLELDSPERLAEIESEVYRLARELEHRMGHAATLRCLRDGLARALLSFPSAVDGRSAAPLRIIARVTDAVWSAHSDVLEATIHRQREERIMQELTLAKRIQERLLPRSVPVVPGFDIAGKVLTAAEIGGDYWSCKSYPEDDIVTFKLADVTGHGIAAATLVAAVKFISGGYYRGAKTAAQVMERTNTVLVRETPHEILVTMVYGWLYPHSREMSLVNAGHSPVLHYRNGKTRVVPPTGMALGLMETRYRELRVAMDPGDIFFTCSDGVTEPSAEMSLGEAWVQQRLEELHDRSAAEMVDVILEDALRAYGAPLDDMSILAIKCTG